MRDLEKINLDVKKDTFLTYLIRLGYNYKIRQYDELISTIRRKILKDIQIGITENKLKESMIYIFDSANVNLLILEESERIVNISPKYLKDSIELGFYDLFIEEQGVKPSSIEVQKEAYFYKQTKDIVVGHRLRNLFPENINVSMSIRKCLLKDNFTLSEQEKSRIDYIIKDRILKYIISRNDEKVDIFLTILNKIFLERDKFNFENFSKIILAKFKREDFLDIKNMNNQLSIDLDEEDKNIKSLLTTMDSLSRIIGTKHINIKKWVENAPYYMFKSIKENDCGIYFPQCKGKDIFEILKKKVDSEEYNELLEMKEYIVNYKKPDLNKIYIVLDLGERQYKLSMDEIYEDLI